MVLVYNIEDIKITKQIETEKFFHNSVVFTKHSQSA